MLDRAAVNLSLRLALLPAPPPHTDPAKLLTFVKQERVNHKGCSNSGRRLWSQGRTRIMRTLVQKRKVLIGHWGSLKLSPKGRKGEFRGHSDFNDGKHKLPSLSLFLDSIRTKNLS